MSQQTQVKEFFDQQAANYSTKYADHSPFHHYFFNERLEEATEGVTLTNKCVLDIGAGTGNLYDYLRERHANFEFVATDISAEMLAKSNIPIKQQYVGNCYDVDLPYQQFDYIFMLGVTTYFSVAELSKVLTFIQQNLADEGKAIISFTNKYSLDAFSRKLASYPLKALGVKNKVITQSFSRYEYSAKRVTDLLNQHQLQMKDTRYLNHTVFPFNLLLGNVAIKLAHGIKRTIKSNTLLSPLSSDFLMIVEKSRK